MSINIPNLRLAIQALRESKYPREFQMEVYAVSRLEGINVCNTPACVLGNLAARTDLQSVFRLEGTTFQTRTPDGKGWWHGQYDDLPVREFFGITGKQADELFGPLGCGQDESEKNITTDDAIKYIERFIERNS